MPNPGTFRGTRLAFLDSQADIYAPGVRNNQLVDTVADIQRRYLKRYPMSLDHNVEPTQEWLDGIDDSASDPEVQAPSLDSTLDNAAYSAALEKFNQLVNETKARKESIKRRLAYVYSKSCGKDVPLDAKGKKGASDPLTALKAKLAGVDLKVPRMRTAYNVWGPQNRATVDPVFNKRVHDGNVPTNQQLALRSSIYKELFEELSDKEQKKWADMAKDEHDRALEHLKAQEKRAASHSNADYQRVISALPSIVQPMLDLLCEHTGWKFSLEGGGPEPADGGRLNMIFMHSGVAPGSVSVGFGGAEQEAFKKSIMPAFGRYLKRCYNKEACMARALPLNHGSATLANVRFEEEVDVALYRVEHDKPAPKKRLFEVEMDRLNKGKAKAPLPTGTPSPMVRFGPPIGKKKNHILPTKDNPASLIPSRSSSAVFKSSPLAQSVVTADDSPSHRLSSGDAAASSSRAAAAELISATASGGRRDDMPVTISMAELESAAPTAGPDSTSTAATSTAITVAPLHSTSTPHSATFTAAAAVVSLPLISTVTATPVSSPAPSSHVVNDASLCASACIETSSNAALYLPSPSDSDSNNGGPVSGMWCPDLHNNSAGERGTHSTKHVSPPPSPPSTRPPSLPPSPVPSRCTSPLGFVDESSASSCSEKLGAQQQPSAVVVSNGDDLLVPPTPASNKHLTSHDVFLSPTPPPTGCSATPHGFGSRGGATILPAASNPPITANLPGVAALSGAVTPLGVAAAPFHIATPPPGAMEAPPCITAAPFHVAAVPLHAAATSSAVAAAPPRAAATSPVVASAPPCAAVTLLHVAATSLHTTATPAVTEGPLRVAATPPGAATVPTFDNNLAHQAPRKRSKRAGSTVKNAAPPKKQRIYASVTRAFSVSSTDDCPKWIAMALDLLASTDLGPAWRRLVELWFTLEAKHGFNKHGELLPAHGRPSIIGEWIKRGRDPTYRRDIGNLEAFEATYLSWWRSIQPSWRLSADGALLIKGRGDWGSTKCTGANGLLSPLASLFYWGIASSHNATTAALWNSAVEDAVITALGTFDYTKGGHAVLWEFGLVVEFPPGSTVLIPSAAVSHSNTPVGADELRCSFTQYSSGGIFRWVDQGFQKNKKYLKSLSPEEAEKLPELNKARCALGMSLFSTLDELRLSGKKPAAHGAAQPDPAAP